MDVERLLTDLNDAQRAAVTTEASPLCILAGAGSGKTRVLTRRIAYRALTGTADAPHVLALTFTRKAAGELRSRLAALGVRDTVVAGTFHSVAYAQLRRRWADRGERPPALLDRKGRLLAPLVGPTRNGAIVQVADIAAEIEWAKARLIPAAQYAIEAGRFGRTPPVPASAVAAIFERYELEKRRRGLIDFDDLLGLCARAFDEDDEFAATQRWRFRHVFVDEFQDVNPAQFQLLRGWLGDRRDLCVVGDPNQAIYSWNGADPRLLGAFDRLFPGGETVRLDDNYRSTPQVLRVANAILASAPLAASSPAGGGPTHLRPHRADGPTPTVRSYATDAAEARGIAALVKKVHGPSRPWSHVAVLVRTNAQALVLEEAFRAAGIPFHVRGGGAFLDQPEVRQALADLEASPARVPFDARIVDLEAMARTDAGTDDRRLNIEALVRLAREYAALDPQPSLSGFQAWLVATTKGDEPDRRDPGDAVEIATFHRAKGLEWPVVFVAGLEKGFVPIGRAESPEAEGEERRLLYVALTRAEEELHCSWAERRTFGERTISRSPSPWLDIVQSVIASIEGAADAVDWRARIDRERSKLRPAAGGGRRRTGHSAGSREVGTSPDPEVLEALKAWRSSAARAANVPAYVIFHDTTLAAVAELKPRTRDALLAIPGLGPLKAERYGEALLALVAHRGHSA
ncbi:MAG TPA: ATP-dependent DNA helicase UvrD2 [Acidimicrobiales bacterium]|nr:ATP-dependent DNA helicase UvrD2 [Acidimicrobiales bacterium]